MLHRLGVQVFFELLGRLKRAGGGLVDLDWLFGRGVHPGAGGAVFFGEGAEAGDGNFLLGLESFGDRSDDCFDCSACFCFACFELGSDGVDEVGFVHLGASNTGC